jgi:hypothetical protein
MNGANVIIQLLSYAEILYNICIPIFVETIAKVTPIFNQPRRT